MAKFYIDTEFVEGFRKPYLGLFGQKRHFIDLISICLFDAERNRAYYGICKEFDLDYAWKDVWLRENVLRPIHTELVQREGTYGKTYFPDLFMDFTKECLKTLLKWHGHTREHIANNIREFVYDDAIQTDDGMAGLDEILLAWLSQNTIEFVGYYCDYDWVLFCSLFGRMVDLPKGFPMYCTDLQQRFDATGYSEEYRKENFPDPVGMHSALVDARWNKGFEDFLDTLAT